jgi:hypothetical protein
VFLDYEISTLYPAHPPVAHTTLKYHLPPPPNLCVGQRGHHSAPTGQCIHRTLHPRPVLAAAVTPTVRIFAQVWVWVTEGSPMDPTMELGGGQTASLSLFLPYSFADIVGEGPVLWSQT